VTEAQRIKITELADAFALAELQQKGYNLVLENAEPHEKFRVEMEKNRLALAAIGATGDQVARVQQKTAEKYGATWEQVTAQAAGGFAAFANEMGKSNAQIALAGKALAIVEATINTYVAFTKALASVPPPLNYIAAAGVLAAGLAKVAAIKSQNIPKMATGGAMRMSGFASGPDSQLLTARIRPDEQVDIWRPGEGPEQRGGARAMAREIVIRVDEISRATVEKLIPALNSALDDGYHLKMGT